MRGPAPRTIKAPATDELVLRVPHVEWERVLGTLGK